MGYIKGIMYWTIVSDLPDLHHRIIDAVVSTTPEMLRNIWIEIEYQLDARCSTGGAHAEICCHNKTFVEFLHFSPQIAYMYLHWE
jgi:hypothetical protein